MLSAQVKICGITTVVDAELSHSLGADYLGLIFAESPRRVSVERALQIRQAVPEALLVGVFRDAALDVVVDTCRRARINLIQLHGAESPEFCDELLRRAGIPIIKAIGPNGLRGPNRIGEYHRTSYFLLDLDKNNGARPNGGAVTPSQEKLWDAAAGVRRKGYRIFLAGALNRRNVRAALRHVSPYCIDVAAGVESSPGVKDPESLGRFIREVKG